MAMDEFWALGEDLIPLRCMYSSVRLAQMPDGQSCVFFDVQHGPRLTRTEWEWLREQADRYYSEFTDEEIIDQSRAEYEESLQRRTAVPQRVSRKGWIYILRGESGHHKIGRSKEVAPRVEKLATQAPYSVKLIHSFPCVDMVAAERALHEKFKEKRGTGEWFSLDAADVEWLKTLTEWK